MRKLVVLAAVVALAACGDSTGPGSSSALIGSGTVVSGTLSGNSVTFNLDTSDWHNSGTISGSSMSGSVTVQLNVSGTIYFLSGTFGAARS